MFYYSLSLHLSVNLSCLLPTSAISKLLQTSPFIFLSVHYIDAMKYINEFWYQYWFGFWILDFGFWFWFVIFISSNFLVHRIIGRGGFGEVYGCRKADTGKMYAMKVCTAVPSMCTSPSEWSGISWYALLGRKECESGRGRLQRCFRKVSALKQKEQSKNVWVMRE